MDGFSIHHLFVLLIMLWVFAMPLAVVGFVIWYVQRNRQSAPVPPANGAHRRIDVRSAPAARTRQREQKQPGT